LFCRKDKPRKISNAILSRARIVTASQLVTPWEISSTSNARIGNSFTTPEKINRQPIKIFIARILCDFEILI
jgi:hypothetical protein